MFKNEYSEDTYLWKHGSKWALVSVTIWTLQTPPRNHVMDEIIFGQSENSLSSSGSGLFILALGCDSSDSDWFMPDCRNQSELELVNIYADWPIMIPPMMWIIVMNMSGILGGADVTQCILSESNNLATIIYDCIDSI